MKCKVRLTYEVEMFVEGESEEAIQEWLLCNTPQEAKECAYQNGKKVTEHYDEEIICPVRDDSEVDYVIKEEEI